MMTAILAKYRNSILAAILAAILAGCLEFPTPPVSTPAASETVTARPIETAKPTKTARATARVLPAALQVRETPGGTVIGWLQAGQDVTILKCKDNWCDVRTSELTGWVFRGCLSDHPAGLGCQAK